MGASQADGAAAPSQARLDAWHAGDRVEREHSEWAREHGWAGPVQGWSPGADRLVGQAEPAPDQLEVWRADPSTVPRAWWAWARERGWQGPVEGWEGREAPPAPVAHQRAANVVEREFGRWGLYIEGHTRVSTRSSRIGNPDDQVSESVGDSTVLVVGVDDDGRPLRPGEHATGLLRIRLEHTPEGFVCDIHEWSVRTRRLEHTGRTKDDEDRSVGTQGPQEAIRLALQRYAAAKEELELLDLAGDDRPGVGTAVLADRPATGAATDGAGFSLPVWVYPVGLLLLVVIVGVAVLAGGGATTPEDDPTDVATTTGDDGLGRLGLAALALTREADVGPDGLYSRSSVAPIAAPVGADIRGWVRGIVRLDADEAVATFDQSALPCGADTAALVVTCQLTAGTFGAGEVVVVAVQLDRLGALDGAVVTHGVAFDDDGDVTDSLPAPPPFDWDFFRGAEHWYRLEIAADGTRRLWAESFAGDHVRPRASAAAAVEFGDHLVWFVPRREIPGDQLAVRATVFRNDGDPDAAPPDAAVARGDVTGEDPAAPLAVIDPDAQPLGALDVPDLGPPPVPRVDPAGDPDGAMYTALLEELTVRVGEAVAAGDPTGALWSLVPRGLAQQLDEAACRDQLAATLAQVESVSLDGEAQVRPTGGVAFIAAPATFSYPTGAVAGTFTGVPDGRGRLGLGTAC